MTRSVNPKILREYDVRGVYGRDWDENDAYLLARAFGSDVIAAGGRRVAVGRDGRISTPAIEKAVCEGLSASGLEVLRIGLGPSPMAYFAGFHLEVDACVMVTASHNPGEYNGMKMTLKRKPFFGQQIRHLGARIQEQDFVEGQGSIRDEPVFEAYVKRLMEDFQQHYCHGRPLKIVWDAGNGAAGEVIEALAARLPGEHILLNTEIDGTFPAHHPDPVVEENLIQLRQAVKDEKADLGLAFDGDGDRLGVLDNEGTILWGDQLVQLYASEVLKTHPGAVIMADVKASQVLFDEIARMGGQPLMWRTGHSLIKTKMAEVSSPLAGEMSGHIFFADRYYGYDDALYSAIRTLGITSLMQGPLSDWTKSIPRAQSTPELRIDCEGRADKHEVVATIKSQLVAKGIGFNDLDGLRVTYPHGWWLIRASNTQEVLVARAEAQEDEHLQALVRELSGYLSEMNLSIS